MCGMSPPHPGVFMALATAPLVHIVTLSCKDAAHADRCQQALAAYGRPDALAYGCSSYVFGPRLGDPTTLVLVEQWNRWEDLDKLLVEKVVPALPIYNELLARPFDPSRDTQRIPLA